MTPDPSRPASRPDGGERSDVATAARPSGGPAEAPRLCPHCLAQIGSGNPAEAARCLTCRLVIGAGRSVSQADAAASGRSAQAGAGVLAARARRRAPGAPAGDPSAAVDDLRRIAEDLGVSCERMRMVDYHNAWITDQRLTSLDEVLGAFGSWKAARRVAVETSVGGAAA